MSGSPKREQSVMTEMLSATEITARQQTDSEQIANTPSETAGT